MNWNQFKKQWTGGNIGSRDFGFVFTFKNSKGKIMGVFREKGYVSYQVIDL